MNIALNDTQVSALQWAADQRNAANPKAEAMTAEEFATDLLAVRCDQFAADKAAADNAALAANERLLALGRAVASQPDKLGQIEQAVTAILQSFHPSTQTPCPPRLSNS